MPIAVESAVILGRGMSKELEEWAGEAGLTVSQLTSELHRLALPRIRKAILESAKPSSNVVPIKGVQVSY